MWSRPESDETLVKRLLPGLNPDHADRIHAWAEWQVSVGEAAVLKYIRFSNNTREPDEDIFQEALLTAYLEVERGRYERRAGIPFTAYVKGIARNKIREARRKERGLVDLDSLPPGAAEPHQRQPEASLEQQEEHDALHYGLGRLPVQRRQVLEGILQGQSTTEIAAALRISEELVRQHKCRGLRSLRQMVAQ
jgi:RNA polymerase sigma-70 factor (ECF subfamily)